MRPLSPAGLPKTEPTALAAGLDSDANQSLRPEVSAYGSRKKSFSTAHAPAVPSGPQCKKDSA